MTLDEAMSLLNTFGADAGVRVELDDDGATLWVHTANEGAFSAKTVLTAALLVGGAVCKVQIAAEAQDAAAAATDLGAIRLRAAEFGLHVVGPHGGGGFLVLLEGDDQPPKLFHDLAAVDQLLNEASALHAQAQVRRLVDRLREATR